MDLADDRDKTRAALLDAVDRIRPTLAACADEAEVLRALPEPAWRALHDEGLFRLKAPKELGGIEADPLLQVEVFEAVSYIDTSAGWNLMVGAGTLAMIAGWLPDAGIERFLVDGRLPRVAGGLIPSGTATPVDGGYRVTGQWKFASGSRHAEWFTAATAVVGAEPPRVVFAHFPAGDVTIVDTWFVGGLKGTGSEDFAVEDVFVPESLVFDAGAGPQRGGPAYRIGLPGLVANEHAGFALGAARRALDEMCELGRTKTRGYAEPQGIAARGEFQADLGRHEQALRAARAHVMEANAAAWEQVVATGQPCGPEVQIDLRCAAAYATDVALDVCRRMFRYAGARSLYTGNVIERCLRDVQAAAQHMMVSEESYAERGKVLMGLADVKPIH